MASKELRNKMKELNGDTYMNDIETAWNNVQTLITEVQNSKLKTSLDKGRKKWITKEVLNLMNERRDTKNDSEIQIIVYKY